MISTINISFTTVLQCLLQKTVGFEAMFTHGQYRRWMRNAMELYHTCLSTDHELKGISIPCHIKLKDSITIKVWNVHNIRTYILFMHFEYWTNPITAILSLNARDGTMFIITFYGSHCSIWLLALLAHFPSILSTRFASFIPFQQLFSFFICAAFWLRIV